MATQPSRAQSALTIKPKASAAGLSGAITVVVLYCLSAIWDIEPPAEVAAAITVIVAFVCSWLAPTAAE